MSDTTTSGSERSATREEIEEWEEENDEPHPVFEVDHRPERQPVRKRKAVPSVLVDCRECGEPFEITSRDFDLAHEVDSDPSFQCDDCNQGTVSEREGGGR